jgi:hypothetical protein
MAEFMKRFMEWQNYVHYLLLTIVLTVFMHFNSIHLFHTEMFLPNMNFLYLYITIFVADTLIHGIFWYLPKGLRWRD